NPQGILVDMGTSNGIHANSIFSNTVSGILLENNGNHDQPAPSLTGASRPTPTTIQVNGFLKAAANTTYRVEIFASPSNPSQGQGQNFLGSVLVMTNPRGRGSFVFNSTFAPSAGTSITATATDPANNTSAFSAPISLGGNANELFVASVYGLLL